MVTVINDVVLLLSPFSGMVPVVKEGIDKTSGDRWALKFLDVSVFFFALPSFRSVAPPFVASSNSCYVSVCSFVAVVILQLFFPFGRRWSETSKTQQLNSFFFFSFSFLLRRSNADACRLKIPRIPRACRKRSP